MRAENPLTLKYLYLAVHDLNIVHLLTVMGYFDDTAEIWGASFNASVRFEVYQTEPSPYESLDDGPMTFIRVLYDETVIPCSQGVFLCPLGAFINEIKEKIGTLIEIPDCRGL